VLTVAFWRERLSTNTVKKLCR